MSGSRVLDPRKGTAGPPTTIMRTPWCGEIRAPRAKSVSLECVYSVRHDICYIDLEGENN